MFNLLYIALLKDHWFSSEGDESSVRNLTKGLILSSYPGRQNYWQNFLMKWCSKVTYFVCSVFEGLRQVDPIYEKVFKYFFFLE